MTPSERMVLAHAITRSRRFAAAGAREMIERVVEAMIHSREVRASGAEVMVKDLQKLVCGMPEISEPQNIILFPGPSNGISCKSERNS